MIEYIIGTGFHARPGRGQEWFWRVWLANTARYAKPREVIVMASGKSHPELTDDEPPSNWFFLSGNLGHCGMLLHGNKPYRFSGGTAGVLGLAWLCYLNEADFIHKEQDTLAFGPWVERMYSEIGNRGCIFGNTKGMPSQQCLMLVRHAFIPDLLRLYLGTPRENVPDQMGECKFARLQQQHPDLFCRYSFGYDRGRPFNSKDPVWHVSKLTPDELRQLAREGLVDISGMPAGQTDSFSNA